MNKFLENKKGSTFFSSRSQEGSASLSPLIFPSFAHSSSLLSLVVALESLRHEQLPEVLRGEFLHVLAVVVNLPCWWVATFIHEPPHRNTNTHPHKHTYIHLYTDMHTNRRRRERGGGGGRIAAQQNIKLVGSRVNGRIRNVVKRRRRAEQRETAGKRAVCWRLSQ